MKRTEEEGPGWLPKLWFSKRPVRPPRRMHVHTVMLPRALREGPVQAPKDPCNVILQKGRQPTPRQKYSSFWYWLGQSLFLQFFESGFS
jgi:hypothetical protein